MAAQKPPSSHFTLLYFATASAYTRKISEFFEGPIEAVELFNALEKRYPGIKAKVLDSSALTVNREYVDVEDGVTLKPGDEIAIIPPVSSG
ncbi:MAG: hypothetical protein M1820_007905 [Bogoriella megaspora]|nr:MAG: hypothetical protein M1820_007905 [Bogoriella megaspora]